jgi:hypothetical protein
MLDEWNNWFYRLPFRHRMLIKAWRMFLRVQRSTLANAVLVLRRQDGQVLALPSPYGKLELPIKELDGWKTVTTQVDDWLEQLVQQRQTPQLVAIEGTPGRRGVTFLFKADIPSATSNRTDGIWLDADVAIPMLNPSDRGLLLLSQG